ncbi:MAG: hypothetical protein R3190_07605, partial [Thermoanaerobaculia bacterium]|nr:hypothetical protein [Thermoanaerobaculia bacterium]
AWVEDRWDAIDPGPAIDAAHLASLGLPPLSELLVGGRQDGLVRLFACSASVRILDLDAGAVQSRVDAILGWQSFARMIESAEKVVGF